MKKLFLKTIFILIIVLSFIQCKSIKSNKMPKTVTIIGIIDTVETKSGFQINDYFIQISEKELNPFKGKKVKITGELIVIEALDPNDKIIKQGSNSERKFIQNPKIEIIN